MSGWRKIIDERIARLHAPAGDKRSDLGAAIRKHVRPGMKINPCSLQGRPCAAVYEICRQFAGTDPGFEFISSSMGGTYLALVHLGLVKRAIVSFAGEAYPTPGPSPIIREALAAGRLSIENYTMLTVPQRLLAGAMGVPFIATRSLAGSSIGEEAERAGNFKEIDDPFNAGGKAGLLRAYSPDISFVHAWAADAHGNAICFPPYAENIYGALAAKQGVVLTADHIVSTDFIRKHSHLVRIPGEIVLSVSHAPYGAHPTGNYSRNIPEFRPYGNDYKFMIEHRRATRTREAYDAWLEDWVFAVKDHAGYLKKLGEKRVEYLHWVAEPDSWRAELEEFAGELSAGEPAGAIETMMVQASRAISAAIRERGYRTVLSGVGQATLMAWLAAHKLREEGIEFAMMAETGIYGHDPRPSDPFVFNYRNLPTTTMLTDIFETLGLHTGGGNNRCLGTIGAGQIDKWANVNSTYSADGGFIVGSGGANDIASAAQETVVLIQQRKEAFLEKVDYVTSPGRNIRTVISTMGRYEKADGKELVLTGYFGMNGADEETAVREIKEQCGWNLRVSDGVERLADPEEDEITLLRLFDPERFFCGKQVKAAAGAGAKAGV